MDFEGAWHHVMNRGARRVPIFHDDKDCKRFLSLLAEIRAMWNVEVHAYCLMGNHYHLLIRTPNANLSRGLRHLNGIYTQYYNAKYGKDGALLRGRFKSILVENGPYLQKLLRYIHLNPVKAGFCKNPSSYRWSSHAAYVGKSRPAPWLIREALLSEFGGSPERARRKLAVFMVEGGADDMDLIVNAKRRLSVLGSTGFKDWVKDNLLDETPREKKIPALRAARRQKAGWAKIQRLVSQQYDCSSKSILSVRTSVFNEPRAMASYLYRQVDGASHSEIAKVLVNATPTTVAKTLQRFSERLGQDSSLMTKAQTYVGLLLNTSDR